MIFTSSRSYMLYLYIFLGALTAFPPLVTDMYLPALPTMANEFSASPTAVQLSLATCILGLALGQLVFGPLSDKYGRRPVLGAALVLFTLATLACIHCTDIGLFNLCRFFQGLAGAGGVVLSRSVATDCYSGRALARTLAIIGAINGIAPVVAPVVGGLFAASIGWQGIFRILFWVGIALIACFVPFQESHPAEKRHESDWATLMRQPVSLLRNSRFMVFVLLFGLSNGVLFGYISSAAFILQNDFGLSELMFGAVFAVNSLAIAGGSILSLRFADPARAVRVGVVLVTAASAAMLGPALLGYGLWSYEIPVFAILIGVGILFPATTTLAMTEGRSAIGWASAIVGATGFLFGGVVTPIVGAGEIRLSTALTLLVCAVASLISAFARGFKSSSGR